MRINPILIAVALAAAACLSDAVKRTEEPLADKQPAPSQGKPEAPVTVAATTGASSARVSVRFGQAGSSVEIRARGVDGLKVSGQELLASGKRVAADEELAFDVAYAPGAGQSLLVVEVSGVFAAGERTSVRAFPVGEPSAEQRKRMVPPATTVGGERVKLMNAEEKPAPK